MNEKSFESDLLLLRLRGFRGEQLLQGRMSVAIGRRRGTWCAGRAGVASRRIRGVRAGGGTAGTDALVHLATSVMILRVSPQTPRVTVRLAASFCLAFVWLLVSMRQHVPVSATETTEFLYQIKHAPKEEATFGYASLSWTERYM